MIPVPLFVVTGGGAWGVEMARRLVRARAAGRLETSRIVLVDRDPGCDAAALAGGPVELAIADWGDWLDAHVDAVDPAAHLVPWHFAPHLLSDWLARRLRAGGAIVERAGPPPPQGLPWEAETRAGDRAASYATWACPPSCIEPDLCPHTRGPKEWSLAGRLAEAPDRVVFACLHLVWGVGTVPLRELRAARDRLSARAASGETFDVEVATASHCHGLVGRLRVQPLPAAIPAG